MNSGQQHAPRAVQAHEEVLLADRQSAAHLGAAVVVQQPQFDGAAQCLRQRSDAQQGVAQLLALLGQSLRPGVGAGQRQPFAIFVVIDSVQAVLNSFHASRDDGSPFVS